MSHTALTPRALRHTTPAPTPTSRMLAFDVEGSIRLFELSAELIRIGNSLNADLCLDDGAVSRRHAYVLTRPDGSVEVIDDRSLSGTFVNGTRVDRRALVHGDTIRTGGTTFCFLDVPSRWI